MKKYILFSLLYLFTRVGYAQDTIVKTDTKEIIFCRVTATSSTKIFYTENSVGKFIPKKEVSYFSNHGLGKKESSDEEETEKGTENFKFKILLSNNFSLKKTYHFSIFRVVDGRLDKKKPIGSVLAGFSFKPQNVGNDSLSESMNLFFKRTSNVRDMSKQIVLVLNELSLRYIGGYSVLSGKVQDLEMTFSIDYYMLQGDTCYLIYQQQQRQYRRSVKYIAKASKAINLTFFETIESALNNFALQLERKQTSNLLTVPLDTLLTK